MMLSRRCYGRLDAVTDSERRALRPIGLTAREVAIMTEALLTGLFTLPDVRIFRGVRPAGMDAPRIPHVISAGRRLVFIESVAWPPGRYVITESGQIYCDGVYIGQSVRPLIATARCWGETLPPGHRVSALVIVHPTAGGELALPATMEDLAWSRASDAVRDIRAHLLDERQATSMRAIAALIAATAQEETGKAGVPEGDRIYRRPGD